MNTKKATVFIDTWKVPIFVKHLDKGGFTYVEKPSDMPDIVALTVETNDLEHLKKVLTIAMADVAEAEEVRVPRLVELQMNPRQIAFAEEARDLIARHNHLNGQELLAIASQLVGALIAFQDQTEMTKEMLWQIITQNVEAGNMLAVADALGTPQGSA